MPLISKQHRPVKKDQLNVKIDPAVAESLRMYSLFVESSQHHVVEEALRYLFSKDREFQAWSDQQEPAGGTTETNEKARRPA